MSNPLITHDSSECYRLVGRADRATVELHRHRLPMPLNASYAMDGLDVLLSVDARQTAALLDANVSVSVVVDDPDTRATWRVILLGTAMEAERALRVRPASIVGYRVLEHAGIADCA